jgi:15-cis-phytoene synthase
VTMASSLSVAPQVPTAQQFAAAAFVVAPPPPDDYVRYLARHSRSCRFAASQLPPRRRDNIAAVYAYCRYTDDLVDHVQGLPPGLARTLIDAWVECSRAAYQGERTDIPLVDRVMSDMAAASVPFAYAAELAAGMRMDLDGTSYSSLGELRVYTYRVASVVGLWLTELAGVREAWMLERASLLGHALQLTNIVRDVGEDWDRGRLYLPLDRMRAHGVTTDHLTLMRSGGMPVSDEFRALLEEMMQIAESAYAIAKEALPGLPRDFARSIAVAASVYAGIHDAVRRNDYDTLRVRAFTTVRQKIGRAARALRGLYGNTRGSRLPMPALGEAIGTLRAPWL